jgi:hypothetical protein
LRCYNYLAVHRPAANRSAKSSQVSNHQLRVLHCAKSNSKLKNRIFRGNDQAEAPPVYQAGWSGRMYFSLFVRFIGSSGFSV